MSNEIDACASEDCTYTASDLTPGMDYFVKTYAQDANDNESQGSMMASFKTLAIAEVPRNVAASGDLLKITITWESEADGRFNLYWSTIPGVSAKGDEYEGKIEDLSLEALPYVHENLQGNTTYYYVVTAVNSIGKESDLSSEVSATVVGDTSYAITLDETGNVFITGRTFGGLANNTNRGADIFVAKYASDGEMQWVALHGDDVGNHGYSIAVDQEHCYVSGRWDWDLHISQFKVDDGAHQWTKRIEGVSPEALSNALVFASNGNLLFVGHTALLEFDDQHKAGEGDYAFDILLMAYDASGERQWSKLFGTPVRDFARKIPNSNGNNYTKPKRSICFPFSVSLFSSEVIYT